jgi:hypothetical protein
MIRLLVTSVLALGLVALGCNKSSDVGADNTGEGGMESDSGGSGPAAKGGSGGTHNGSGGSASGGSASGGSASGGSSDSGGTPGSGGSSDSGGSGGGTGSGGSATDGPSAGDDAGPADASPGDGYNPGGDPWPGGGRPYIHLCKPEWNQTQCCQFLCDCVNNLCTDSPKDKTYIPNCMTMCGKLGFPRARCQVFHCFESKSPTAVADHESHCGHATGRVGGGSCTGVP